MVSRPEHVIGNIIAQYQEREIEPVKQALQAWADAAMRGVHAKFSPCPSCSGPTQISECQRCNAPSPCYATYCVSHNPAECSSCELKFSCTNCLRMCSICKKSVCRVCLKECFSCLGTFCKDGHNKDKCDLCNTSRCPRCRAHKCEPGKK